MAVKNEHNGYNLTRAWFNYKFDNPGNLRAIHAEMYFYIVDLWNRLGQKENFGLPTDVTMQALEIGSYKTYKKTFEDLVEHNFIIEISKSQNQYKSRIIALAKSAESLTKSLDKSLIKASTESSATIDKQLNKEQLSDYLLIDKNTYGLNGGNNNPLYYSSYKEFLKDWNLSRISLLGVKVSNLNILNNEAKQNFDNIKTAYPIEDFKKGMRGLMMQQSESLATLNSMQTKPNYFLKDGNVEQLIDAFDNKKQLWSGAKKTDKL